MTPEEIYARMNAASARLVELQAELERKDALLRSGRDVNGDGSFDEGDSAEVSRVRARRDALQVRIDGLLQQYIVAQAEADGTPVETIDFEDGLYVEGDNHRIQFEADRNAFITQINTWRVDVRESLGHMVNTMLDPDDDGPSFPKNDVLSLAMTALTASQPELAAAITVANTILDLVVTAYRASLPATPSLREIETKWRDAIDGVTDAVAGARYDELIDLFRSANHMDTDEQYVYATYIADWNALINGFRGGDVLPSGDQIKRVFMAHIISQMPDSSLDLDWTSGEVYIRMEFDMDRNSFAFTSGSVDDITSAVQKGLRADPNMFGSDRVISLPTDIRFHISGSGWTDGTYCEIYRRSKTSGDTSFQLSPMPIGTDTTLEEQSTLYQIFMDRRIYTTVTVSQVIS